MHWRIRIASLRQPIPELVEVARKVGLEFRNRLSIHASRSLVNLHTLEGFPDFPLGDLERLCLVHGLLPFPVGQCPRLNNAAPSLRPITGPSTLLRAAPPLRSASVLLPS